MLTAGLFVQPSWAALRDLGVPLWMKSDEALRVLVEKCAKTQVHACLCGVALITTLRARVTRLSSAMPLGCTVLCARLVQYANAGRDPFAAILLYVALGPSKHSVLTQLFRLSKHSTVYNFLVQDVNSEKCVAGFSYFSPPLFSPAETSRDHGLYASFLAASRFQRTAGKNAFQLLSQHRNDAAAAFFLLARQ